jgi:asparagine synthetase B (glutamine-hydrolysing)
MCVPLLENTEPEGLFIENNIGFVYRRLSILDIKNAHPFFQMKICNGVQWRNLQLQGLAPSYKK